MVAVQTHLSCVPMYVLFTKQSILGSSYAYLMNIALSQISYAHVNKNSEEKAVLLYLNYPPTYLQNVVGSDYGG